MSGERRGQPKVLWETREIHDGDVHYQLHLDEEMMLALTQEIDNEILADLNKLHLPHLLCKLVPIHMKDFFPR